MFKNFTIKRMILLVVLVIVVALGVIAIFPGHTDPIVDVHGRPVLSSIAVMEEVELGGVEQWIVMRGVNPENPVLLLLSGGPGGTEMGRFLKYSKKLEKDFVVVNWEQRGCGKSFAKSYSEDLTVEQYVSDIRELAEYLKDRFGKEKIYLLGHSWGSIIGTMAVQQYPDLFHAYIGAAQMVNIRETDQYMYNYVLEAAERAGDQKLVERLQENGEPPYDGESVLNQYKPFLTKYAVYYKEEHPFEEKNTGWFNPFSILMISEYNVPDQIGAVRGLIKTFNTVYPQLQDVDFVTQANQLEVPAYYLIGRHDYTGKFIEEYYEVLEAPQKRLFWFENSAHGEVWTEPDQFYDIMVNTVLAETQYQ